ncbi:MAG: beta-galactosidase [Armatimonadetes bacterium]|nr:beta-galactosidase [Armatimonadota bacterium]
MSRKASPKTISENVEQTTKPATKSRAKKPEAPAPDPTPVKTTRSKKTVEPVVEAPVKAKTTRAKKVEEPATVPEVKPKATRAAKEPKASAKRAPKPRQEPAPAELDAGDIQLVPRWRPKSAAVAEKTEEATAASVKAPRAENRPKKGAKAKPAKAVQSPAFDVGDAEKRVVVLAWRPRDANAKRETPVEEPVETAVAAEEPKYDPRKHKERGRRGKKEEAAPVAAAVVEEPAPPPPPPAPVVPVREPISIPETAAQVIVRDGHPVLVKDRKVLPPLFFFAQAHDEARLATVMEEVKMAAEHGVHLFSTLVELDVDPKSVDEAVQVAGYLLKKFTETDPEGLVLFRTTFVAPPNWEKSYPEARYVGEDGQMAEPSVCDDTFWDVAESCLTKFVEKLSALPGADRILGVHLERGEWFFADGNGYDTSTAAHKQFRDWLRHRYRNDETTLRAAWFDGSAKFEFVNVPPYRDHTAKEAFVRTDRRSRRWVDYHLFLSDVTAERIEQLAYAAKKASQGMFLVGVSYGYTFEWSHPASGHLSLGKLLRSPEIDYIAGPPSYKNREPGGTCPFPAPVDSFALNGKLYLSEEDFKTPISGRQEPDDFNPVMKTPQALESVHWRGAGAALSHGGGVVWMDSWGNGWLNSRGIWERAETVRDTMVRRLSKKPDAPEVAMFIDERSLALLVDERAFGILVQNVREAVLRCGLSVGFYLLSDLAHRENFPDAKLYVFVNAWDVRPEVRSAIKSRLQRDGKVLFWLYAAGLFEGGRESLERVREVTGIALRPQPFYSRPGTTLLNFRDPLASPIPAEQIAQGGQLEPSYFAIPEDSNVLGEYTQTGLPSYVVRKFKGEHDHTGDWTSVFLGEPIVTPGLFRALGQMAGCHIWSFHDDVVHVDPPFLTVHCKGTGPRTITLPDKWVAYDLVSKEYLQAEANGLKFVAIDGTSHTFVVGTPGDVQMIVNSRIEDLAEIKDPIVRDENTLHWDRVKFEVPIMKLDEWVEESWSDSLADDLLIKPSMLDIDLNAPDTVDSSDPGNVTGRRRRRRKRGRGGPDRTGSEETFAARHEGADREAGAESKISVLFRKRE